MQEINQLVQDRLNKIVDLEAYPSSCKRDISNKDFIKQFDELLNNQNDKTLAGRIMSKRGQGKLIFMDIYDGTDKVQILAKLPESNQEVLTYIDKYLDIADFVEVRGVALLSKTGQKSLLIKEIRIITKALLPMPDIWHGIENEELRLRKRYLEILTNAELRDIIEKRAKF
ncbi:MAG: OB-fold nucleic acid binding domain-containing protein [Cyanobium sp. MAG06]|nr:OB-fold nucleic acid binding domain-containing protein [Cyanobium sp. MAG06]